MIDVHTTPTKLTTITAKNDGMVADRMYYCQKVKEVFQKFQIDGTYTDEGILANIDVWLKNKESLFAVLRKHPGWNEVAKAIVFEQDMERGINRVTAALKLCEIRRRIRDYCGKPVTSEFIHSLIDAMDGRFDISTTMGEEEVAFLRKSERPPEIDKMLKVGCKWTRIVRKAFQYMRDEENNIVDVTGFTTDDWSFEKAFAEFADALSPLTIKRLTLISANILDFLTMSHGNSWSSCHYINSHGLFYDNDGDHATGSYKQGCLSYALDGCSLLLYTIDAEYTGNEYYMQPKINRQCCQYRDGVLISGKVYPGNSRESRENNRHILQEVFAELENFPNRWSVSEDTNKIAEWCDTATLATHYPDYGYSEQHPTVSIKKPYTKIIDDVDDEGSQKIIIGHEAYCVHCGISLHGSNAKWLQCVNHFRDHTGEVKCSRCGNWVSERDAVVINGESYCKDCVYWCDGCKTYHVYRETPFDTISVAGQHDERRVYCTEYIANHFVQCHICERYTLKDMAKTDGTHHCSRCAKRIEEESKIASELVQKEAYCIGDIVITGLATLNDSCGCVESMSDHIHCYAVITDVSRVTCSIQIEPNHSPWNYDYSSILGAVPGATKETVQIGEHYIFNTSKKEG